MIPKIYKIGGGLLVIAVGAGVGVYLVSKSADALKAAWIKVSSYLKMNKNGEKVPGTTDQYQADTNDESTNTTQSSVVMITYNGSFNDGTVISGSNGASIKLNYEGVWMYDWANVTVQICIVNHLKIIIIPAMINAGYNGELQLDGYADEVRMVVGGTTVQKWSKYVENYALKYNDETHLQRLSGIVWAKHSYT